MTVSGCTSNSNKISTNFFAIPIEYAFRKHVTRVCSLYAGVDICRFVRCPSRPCRIGLKALSARQVQNCSNQLPKPHETICQRTLINIHNARAMRERHNYATACDGLQAVFESIYGAICGLVACFFWLHNVSPTKRAYGRIN